MTVLDCEKVNANHSDDEMAVFVGESNPLFVCGYHYSKLGKELVHLLVNEEKKNG